MQCPIELSKYETVEPSRWSKCHSVKIKSSAWKLLLPLKMDPGPQHKYIVTRTFRIAYNKMMQTITQRIKTVFLLLLSLFSAVPSLKFVLFNIIYFFCYFQFRVVMGHELNFNIVCSGEKFFFSFFSIGRGAHTKCITQFSQNKNEIGSVVDDVQHFCCCTLKLSLNLFCVLWFFHVRNSCRQQQNKKKKMK